MTIAMVFALSVVGPYLSGVWAQSQDVAACDAGWEWVRSCQSSPLSPLLRPLYLCAFMSAHAWVVYAGFAE